MQAAAALAKAAAAHAQDGSYASPYAADAAAHGKDIPLWAKIKEGKFKKGKFSLAKLRVRTSVWLRLMQRRMAISFYELGQHPGACSCSHAGTMVMAVDVQGGKLDDVTAVVALVQQSEEAFSPTTPHVSEHRLQSSLSHRYSDV